MPPSLTPETLRQIANEIERREREQAGDGRAEYMGDMTDAEYAQHILENDHGWKDFYDKVLGRKKDGGTP